LYEWVLRWAETPYGGAALFALAFAEASVFPIPPDVLLIALALGRTRRAFHYAALCTTGSLLGAAAGYAIGWAAAPLAKSIIGQLAGMGVYYQVADAYGENAFLAIAVAGFTPVPYKVFTLAAGIFHESVSLGVLLAASLCSRTARFFLVAGLIFFFGPPVKRFIERYFNALALLFGVLLVLGFLLLGGLGGGPPPLSVQVRVHLHEMSHADADIRAQAHEALLRLASDRGKPPPGGYDPLRSPQDNAEALRAWSAWWEESLKAPPDKAP
jgi:membrane protein YqaA with SNARE-associated domain